MTRSRNPTGAIGEQKACDWLIGQGFHLIARNWRCQEGEIDIVALEGDTLIFLEVRTRTTTRFGTAEESVDWRKQRQVRRLAAIFLTTVCPPFRRFRFDVIVVYLKRNTDEVTEIRLIRNAF
jgi:putative endonuclease